MTRLTTATLFAAPLLLLSLSAHAYTFTNVIDSTGPQGLQFSSSGPAYVGGNLLAAKAFAPQADNGSGSNGIITAALAQPATILDASPLLSYNLPALNASGTVAYRRVASDPTVFEIVSAAPGASPAVLLTTAAPSTFTNAGAAVAINAAGQVAIHASIRPFDSLYRFTPGFPEPTLIAGGSNPSANIYASAISNNVIDINASGAVLGIGSVQTVGGPILSSIFSSDGINLQVLGATSGSPPFINFQNDGALNDSGTAFFNIRSSFAPQFRLYTATPTSTTLVDDSATSPFASYQSLDINNDGTLAFLAATDSAPNFLSLYVGTPGNFARVIGPGDALFGDTVAFIGFNHALANDGSLAISYGLNNGVTGLAIISIPEPTSLALPLLLTPTLLRRRR